MSPRARNRPPTNLVPLEAFLIGAWISLTLTAWLARRDLGRGAAALESPFAFHVGCAEALLGSFVVLLALRRRAHGLSLLLPFAALAIALAFVLIIHPETARMLRADHAEGVAAYRLTSYALDLAKVVVLFLAFTSILRRHKVTST